MPAITPDEPMIDLTEDHSDPSADIFMALTPEPPIGTTPSTPHPNTPIVHPPPSGSFIVDESLSNPWKSGHTFTF